MRGREKRGEGNGRGEKGGTSGRQKNSERGETSRNAGSEEGGDAEEGNGKSTSFHFGAKVPSLSSQVPPASNIHPTAHFMATTLNFVLGRWLNVEPTS